MKERNINRGVDQSNLNGNRSLQDLLPHDEQGRIAWKQMSQEEIASYLEKKAQIMLGEGITLTQSDLRKNKMSWFKKATDIYYPAGLRGLKIKCNQPTIKPYGYWNTDTIKDEAIEFIRIHGNINIGLLKTNKKRGLETAISRRYHGGLRQLKIDCGTAFALPLVDSKGFETIISIAKKSGISSKTVTKYLQRFAVSSIQGIGANHKEITLYNESEALKILEQVKAKQSSKIDSTKANQWFQNLLKENKI